MTKKVLTTDKLITTLKRRSMLPSDQVTFTKQDFIDILNEEFDHGLLPHLMSVHEEYLVNYIDYDITVNETQFSYKIPSRAIGNKLRMVSYFNDQGVMTKLTRVEPEDLVFFQKIGYQTYAYYVQNDMINLVNKYQLSNVNKIRMYFYMSPSKLVEDKYAAKILSINTTTGEIAVDKIPTNFETAGLYDFTGADTPNKLIKYDVAVSAINTTSKILTFATADLSSELNVGDYITIAGESIVPQVPTELHPLLAQMGAVACLESIGDAQGLQVAAQRLQKMIETTRDLIDNRIEGSNQKLNNFNSPLSQTRIRYRRSYW